MQYALNWACFPFDEMERNYELAAAGYDGVEPIFDDANRLADLADRHDLAVPSMSTPAFW